MKRPILKVIRFGGYPFDVLLSVGATPKQTISKLERIMTLTKEDITLLQNDWRDGHSTQLSNRALILWLKQRPNFKPIDIGLVVHETYHTVKYALDSAGVKVSDENSEEAFAYALQDLTMKVLEAIRVP